DPEKGTEYMYFAGVEVEDGMKVPEGAKIHKVPAGHYAVFEHRGDIASIGETYDYIYGKWMYESGRKPARQDMFELYDERFEPGSGESVVEIWVPVIYEGKAEPEPEQGMKQKEELNPRVAPEVVPDEGPDMKVEKE
ncbi:MAG: GyrI-like domain-containing protein, partial [Candidatus Syntrophosphaera sp.]